jgi:hypothetical protein
MGCISNNKFNYQSKPRDVLPSTNICIEPELCQGDPKLKASMCAVLEKVGTLLVLLKIVEILPQYFLIMNVFIA